MYVGRKSKLLLSTLSALSKYCIQMLPMLVTFHVCGASVAIQVIKLQIYLSFTTSLQHLATFFFSK